MQREVDRVEQRERRAKGVPCDDDGGCAVVLLEQGQHRCENRLGRPGWGSGYNKGGKLKQKWSAIFPHSLCVFVCESLVHQDRRWYTGKEVRVQGLREKVDVGQICETERAGPSGQA